MYKHKPLFYRDGNVLMGNTVILAPRIERWRYHCYEFCYVDATLPFGHVTDETSGKTFALALAYRFKLAVDNNQKGMHPRCHPWDISLVSQAPLRSSCTFHLIV